MCLPRGPEAAMLGGVRARAGGTAMRHWLMAMMMSFLCLMMIKDFYCNEELLVNTILKDYGQIHVVAIRILERTH